MNSSPSSIPVEQLPEGSFDLSAVPLDDITVPQIDDLRLRIVNKLPWTKAELQRAIEACRHGRVSAAKLRKGTTKKPTLDPSTLFANMAAGVTAADAIPNPQTPKDES